MGMQVGVTCPPGCGDSIRDFAWPDCRRSARIHVRNTKSATRSLSQKLGGVGGLGGLQVNILNLAVSGISSPL